MKSICFLVTAVTAVTLVFMSSVVDSLPNGAGSCVAGMAAVGGFHLEYGPGSPYPDRIGVKNATLSDVQVNVTINGVMLEPFTTTKTTFKSDNDLVWRVESSEVAYQGILVRVEAPEDVLFSNTGNGELLKNADVCNTAGGNVVGVTHFNATEKLFSSGTLVFAEAGSATIDVTIVFRNDNNISLYGYSAYTITIVDDIQSDIPSEVPSGAPTRSKNGETTSPDSMMAPVGAPVAPTPPTPVEVPIAPPKKEPDGKGMSMDKCLDGKGGMMGKSKEKKGKSGKMMGKGYYDECEDASDAPSDSPSASPTASPTATPTSSKKGKGGMMSGKGSDGGMMGKGSDVGMMGKGGKESDDDGGKGKGGKGGKGGDDEEETEAPAEEEPEEPPVEVEPEPPEEEPSKGKGGMGMERRLR